MSERERERNEDRKGEENSKNERGRNRVRKKKEADKNRCRISESCGLAEEHSAHDQKVMGSIPVQC